MASTRIGPKCDRERSFKRYNTTQGRQCWTCTGCGHHVHPTAGTIFHKSSTSLHLWYYAMRGDTHRSMFESLIDRAAV
jgi:transposase-like protein